MRSIILISLSRNEISCLYEQWRDKAQNIFKTCDRFNMVIDGERIYMDYLPEGEKDYEEDELSRIDISEPSFYSISYSDKEVVEKFMRQSLFDRGSYIDNDLGRIIRIDELREDVSDAKEENIATS